MDFIDVARFWSKVGVKAFDQCWPWLGAKTKDGYGKARFAGRTHSAHRVAFWIAFGTQLGESVIARHKCDRRICCNPYHLLTGTHADNVADRVRRNRSARGESNGRAKLTDAQVRAIRVDPRPNVAICREYGLCHASVSNIKTRRTWSHVTDLPETDTRPQSIDD